MVIQISIHYMIEFVVNTNSIFLFHSQIGIQVIVFTKNRKNN